MQQHKTYADKGMAKMLRESVASKGLSKESFRTGGRLSAQRRKIGVVDGIERADANLKRFSWEEE